MLKYYYRSISLKIFHRKILREIDQIPTHLKIKEKIKLYDLALQSSGNFVEIGSYLGASSCFLALGIRNSNTSSKLFCIDTWQNDSMSEGKWDTYKEFLKNTNQFSGIINTIRGNSDEIAKQFNKKISLLFFDADHSYHQCYQDWMLWKPFLNRGSIVIFHDIGWAEGVQRVVHEQVSPLVKSYGRLPNMYWAKI